MPGRCGRCGKYVGAAEERRALGKSFHLECFTCSICHRGLDSMTVAEHRELNEIYCKSCYRLYIGPDGYGYPPNGPALISYDMEHQNPPPGSEVKWRTPPTRLGKVFYRPKTLPNGQSSQGSRVISKSNTKLQSSSGVKGQGSVVRGQSSGIKGQTSGARSQGSGVRGSKTSTHSRPDSPRPGSHTRTPSLPPLLPPPPPPMPGSSSAERVRSQNSKQMSSHSTQRTSSHKIPPPPPFPSDWTDSKGNQHHPRHGSNSHHGPIKSNHSHQSPTHSNHSHHSPSHHSRGSFHSSHSHHSPVHSNHSGSSHRVFSPSKIPPPPPLPPPPPPGHSRSGQLSQQRVGSHHSRSPSPKKSKSGQTQSSRHSHHSTHSGGGSFHANQSQQGRTPSKSQVQRSRSHSPVKSRSGSAGSGRSRSNTGNPDPNCPPLFYCGGKCVGTPSYPRYPPHHNDARRIPLGPSYGAVRGVPKGIGEKCRRCGRPVFQAELQLGYHGAYHTECFKCCGCGKKLDSTTVAEHQGEIFCKGCYRRNFATSGVGFGIGAGALQTP